MDAGTTPCGARSTLGRRGRGRTGLRIGRRLARAVGQDVPSFGEFQDLDPSTLTDAP